MGERASLAIDIGAESGRGLLGRLKDGKLTLAEIHRFPNLPTQWGGTLYWDFLWLWREVKSALARAAHQESALVSVGVDTWGVDFGLLDEHGGLVGNPIHYRDARTAGMLEAAEQIVPRWDIYQTTGLQFLPFNTLYQLLALRGTKLLDSAKTLLFMPDLLNYGLSGVAAAEYTIASTSQFLDAKQRGWASDLLGRLDLPTGILPKLCETGVDLGPLQMGLQRELGVSNALRVIASAGHDTASAVVGVPATGEGDWCYISSGTWSLMGSELPAPCITRESYEANFTNEGGIQGTTRFLKNIMGLWLVQQCRRSFEKAGRRTGYAELSAAAEQARPFVAIIDPDHPSFLAPPDMPDAIRDRCSATGQMAPAEDAELVRVCLEGLALKYRWTLDRLRALTGREIRRIHVVGGGSQNRLLCQMTAEACQLPIHAGPVEATAIGNLLVQWMGTGDIASLVEGREMVARSFPTEIFEPTSGQRAVWEDAYARFQDLLYRSD